VSAAPGQLMPTTGTLSPFASTIHRSLLEKGSGWNAQVAEPAAGPAGTGQVLESVQSSPVRILEDEDPIIKKKID
jgi:hypothetical protein